MEAAKRETLRSLLRRIEDVRGLSGRADAEFSSDAADADGLLATLGELVEELERSHRRLIETNVQLVSLREVASGMVSARDAGETTRTVTRYLSHAFGFPDVFLALADRERRVLAGTWTMRRDGKEQSVPFEVSLLGDAGAMPRSLWLNRSLWPRDLAHHPLMVLPDGHPLADLLEGTDAALCVPLQRSQALLPGGDAHELCGSRCVIGDAGVLAPPPGPAGESWAYERESRQAHCLDCEFMPQLGVIGIASRPGHRTLMTEDSMLMESIALSVAPVLENARLNQELRTSERFGQHVLDSMASGLVVVDLRGRVLRFNRTAEQLLGLREEDVRDQPIGELLGEEAERLLNDTLEHGRLALRQEALLRTTASAPLPVSMTTSLLRHEGRNVYGAIATFLDLTPLKRAEDHARRLDRLAALGRFTSSVAHEIRNPLAGIAAGVQYLSRGVDSEPQRENLQFIESEIRRLDRIVQELFDVTHPRKLQLRVLPLEDTVRRAARCLDSRFAERRVTLEIEVAPRTPPVPHDPDQLEQVFINLLKNAAEASPPGSRVKVSMAAATPATASLQGPAVSARVTDEGPGIGADHLKTVFEPFFTTKQGGSGLGLYISHDIVKRHGGNLGVSSDTGGGATFIVELPLESNGGEP